MSARTHAYGLRDIDAKIVVRDGEDAGTGTRHDIARVTYKLGVRSYVLLACREDGDWFPTWLGKDGYDAIQLPRGFVMAPELAAAIFYAEGER
jgi:hypothetical protein